MKEIRSESAKEIINKIFRQTVESASSLSNLSDDFLTSVDETVYDANQMEFHDFFLKTNNPRPLSLQIIEMMSVTEFRSECGEIQIRMIISCEHYNERLKIRAYWVSV